MISAGVIVISDGCFFGKREDKSASLIKAHLETKDIVVAQSIIVPDEFEKIRDALLHQTDELELSIIITTGGTGLGPRDVTPEVMNEIIEKDVPGIPMALIVNGLSHTPYAMLSRGRAGVRKKSLIINLPGSPRGVEQGMGTLMTVIAHAVDMMRGGGH